MNKLPMPNVSVKRKHKKNHPWARWSGAENAIASQQKEQIDLDRKDSDMVTYARRVDDNQTEIVKTFRDLGASVFILSNVGRGCPDLLVGVYGITTIVEIKDGTKPLSAQKLTYDEQEFFNKWKGDAHIVRSVDDCLLLIAAMRKKADAKV